MGLFGWRAPPRQPQVDESPIQALHPDFFCRALAAVGTAPTTEKIDAAAKMIAFLWSWTPRCHDPLHRVVKQAQGTILWLSRPTCGSCGSGQLR